MELAKDCKVIDTQTEPGKTLNMKGEHVCKECGKILTNIDVKYENICYNCKVAELSEMFPDVPTEIYDIEPSIEMAEIWYEEFGY